MREALKASLRRHPYRWTVSTLWFLPALLACTGYLVLPDDNWDYGCGSIGCGLPSNITALILGVYWLFLAVPAGLLVLLTIFLHRQLRRGGAPSSSDTSP